MQKYCLQSPNDSVGDPVQNSKCCSGQCDKHMDSMATAGTNHLINGNNCHSWQKQLHAVQSTWFFIDS